MRKVEEINILKDFLVELRGVLLLVCMESDALEKYSSNLATSMDRKAKKRHKRLHNVSSML
jgi:hypothetical protein